MSSVPNSYIDDLRSIVLATLNRIEQLRMRVLFGVQFVKGAYGQELEFRSDGKLYIDDVEITAGGLSNIVEDTTPQLGGDLDCNTKKITGVTEIQTTTSILFKKV